MAARSVFERRITSALDAVPSRIPVILGGCGTGRTFLLHQLRSRLGRSCQYIDVERSATTPERFLRAVASVSPFAGHDSGHRPVNPREAFVSTLGFMKAARGPGGEPVTFLLDEVLELRTFESFPGLRTVLHDLLDTLAASSNRFVLTTRYQARAQRLLGGASGRFEVIPIAALTPGEVRDILPQNDATSRDPQEKDFMARAVHALADGRPVYVREIADEMASMSARGGGDPISALTALLSPGGRLYARCCFSYELRLHRARGYGALKAILEILADQEPLTLTEISQRLQRTPGSTKDYLSWLEDVDLIVARQKRYSFTDPLLRLWVRLHCRPVPPTDEDVAREVQTYALGRLPRPEPALAMAGAGAGSGDERTKPWGIIEID
jgi:hypothetical protein